MKQYYTSENVCFSSTCCLCKTSICALKSSAGNAGIHKLINAAVPYEHVWSPLFPSWLQIQISHWKDLKGPLRRWIGSKSQADQSTLKTLCPFSIFPPHSSPGDCFCTALVSPAFSTNLCYIWLEWMWEIQTSCGDCAKRSNFHYTAKNYTQNSNDICIKYIMSTFNTKQFGRWHNVFT